MRKLRSISLVALIPEKRALQIFLDDVGAVMRRLAPISLLVVLVVASLLGSGCQTEAEAERAQARARQDERTRQVKDIFIETGGNHEWC
jgi:hypothetical protein